MPGSPSASLVGYYLARWFMTSYETEGYQWELHLSTTTTLAVAAGVVVAAVLSQLPALRALRRIDVARIVRERSL